MACTHRRTAISIVGDSSQVAMISKAGTSLDQMQPMQCGTICQVDMDDEATADQLKAMGVCVGRMIEVAKKRLKLRFLA